MSAEAEMSAATPRKDTPDGPQRVAGPEMIAQQFSTLWRSAEDRERLDCWEISVDDRPVVQRPLQVTPLARAHREQVTEWLNDAAIARALDIRGTVSTHHLVQRQLPVLDGDGAFSLESVFVYEVCDASGALVGFCLSYAFDDATPEIRELDYALPGLAKASPAATYEAMVRIAHAVFSTERPRELRVYMRTGKTVLGHVRVFTRFGCEVVAYTPRKNLRGVAFRLLPDAYYASAIIKRYGIARS